MKALVPKGGTVPRSEGGCRLSTIYHYTDPKVRAHVTLCMLALLIQRLIEAQLAAAGISMTASRCLALLGATSTLSSATRC